MADNNPRRNAPQGARNNPQRASANRPAGQPVRQPVQQARTQQPRTGSAQNRQPVRQRPAEPQPQKTPWYTRLWNWLVELDKKENEKKRIAKEGDKQIFVLTLICAFSVYVGFFLLKYTVLGGDKWRVLASQQSMSTTVIPAERGSILDANGTVLAQSSTVWRVMISPKAISSYKEDFRKAYDKKYEKWLADESPDKEPMKPFTELDVLICDKLADLFDLDKTELLASCQNTYNEYKIVARKAERSEINEINLFLSENGINSECIFTEQSSRRYYPNESLAANIIGFTGYDGHGGYGLEAYYDDYLSGTDGKSVNFKNAAGTVLSDTASQYYDAVNGYSLVLTLDEVMQHYIEKNLELCVSQHAVVNRAAAILMDCNTGAILGMATSPSYDLNSPSTLLSEYDRTRLEELKASGAQEEEVDALNAVLREQQWKNKAITELYYPGSVFKTVTCASALEEHAVSLESTFTCAYAYNVSGTTIHCWSSAGHGTLTLQEAITKSCNPSFIQIGQALGKEKFCDYFEAFGFTERTGIDLPGEAQSLYVPRGNMGPVELASSAFGQTNKVTPIQMATALCAIVNGGYLVTPHVVDKVLDSSGNVVETIQPNIKRQVISEETSIQMRSILENIVDTNGGSNAYISGYRIGGKSGTTEKIDEYNAAGGKAGGAQMTYVSSFAAFTPAQDPQVVMLVIADTPTGTSYYGSAVAAPVVSAVFKEGLEHLGIYPTYTAEEQAKQDASVPYVLGSKSMSAESSLAAQGFEVRFVGDPSSGETVSKQVPSSGTTAPKGSTVVLYLGTENEIETGVVPDVIGMTVEQANAAITNAGFNIRIDGGAAENVSAKATVQSIEPEAVREKGTVVQVTFQYVDGYSG